MDLLQRRLHPDVRDTVRIRMDHRRYWQLVYKWRQAGGRGLELAKRMLDVSMKRDTSPVCGPAC
jgi:hypothetical protein